MNNQDPLKPISKLMPLFILLAITTTLLFGLVIYTAFYGEPDLGNNKAMENDPHKGLDIVDGIDLESGLLATGDYELVKRNCTSCHSGKLIAQNRASKEGWRSMINWMQETQGLWDLGQNEEAILEYLESCYGPEHMGRRKNLENIDWYELNPEH